MFCHFLLHLFFFPFFQLHSCSIIGLKLSIIIVNWTVLRLHNAHQNIDLPKWTFNVPSSASCVWLKLISAALIHFLQTFERLNKSGITQSRESFRNIMDDLGSNLSSIIKAKVDSGQELRVVFGNFDYRILTNIILRNHRNSDMHWIAHYVTFDRVPSSHLDDSKPIILYLTLRTLTMSTTWWVRPSLISNGKIILSLLPECS